MSIGWGLGGEAGVVALYCLTDSGTARGETGGPRQETMPANKPPLCGRVGNPLEIALARRIRVLNTTLGSVETRSETTVSQTPVGSGKTGF